MSTLSTVTAVTSTGTSLLGAATTTAGNLSNLILASPQTTIGYQPKNSSNTNSILGSPLLGALLGTPPSFMFHYEGEQTVSLESDITDHFIEDNTSVQDQIALRPEIITTHGYIGELNNVPPLGLAVLQSAANALGTLGAYTPTLSVTALNAYNTAFQLYQTANNAINSAVSAWSSITGGGESVINGTSVSKQPGQNKQQVAFQQFYGYWRDRTLFTIQTPWAVFDNCAILKLRVIQSEETNVISDFEVTFKLIRTASTGTISLSAGRLASQAASALSNGTSTPGPSLGVAKAFSSSFP